MGSVLTYLNESASMTTAHAMVERRLRPSEPIINRQTIDHVLRIVVFFLWNP